MRNRTADLHVTRVLLYRLSYLGIGLKDTSKKRAVSQLRKEMSVSLIVLGVPNDLSNFLMIPWSGCGER